MNDQLKFSFVFVLGMGHSGTTLLGRMLGTYPGALCVGELLRLPEAMADPDDMCSCGEKFSACRFWQELLPGLPEKVKLDWEEWKGETFEGLKTRLGKELIVDTSKSRAFRLLSRWKKHRPGFVVMIRDPRGVMRSALRRGGELTDLLKIHRKWIKRYLAFAKKNPEKCVMVYYEDLIANPEAELRRVCHFIGLPFQPVMLTPDSTVQHLVRASSSRYLKGTNRLEKDERWRQELAPEQIEKISRYLGKVRLYRERYQLA